MSNRTEEEDPPTLDRVVSQFGIRGLQPLGDRLEDLVGRLVKHTAQGLIAVDASPLLEIERHHGARVLRTTLGGLVDRIRQRIVREVGDDFILTCGPLEEERLLFFFPRPRSERDFYLHDLPQLADEIRGYACQALQRAMYPYLRGRFELPVGWAVALHRSVQRPEAQIRRLVDSAMRAAWLERDRVERERTTTLERMLLDESLQTVYEPIVRLQDNHVIGYEALSRGPAECGLESPLALFEVATRSGLDFELDSLCRRQALRNARGIANDQRLFLNVLPSCIHDPDFENVRVRQVLEEHGLAPHNLVLEISEREAIGSYPVFREALDHFSSMGFEIALDDTGSGFASLEAALELSPDWLKIDMSLVRGIGDSPEKQEVLRGLERLSHRLNSKLIAEGIETNEEMRAIRELGIGYGQGFYLGRSGAVGERR